MTTRTSTPSIGRPSPQKLHLNSFRLWAALLAARDQLRWCVEGETSPHTRDLIYLALRQADEALERVEEK